MMENNKTNLVSGLVFVFALVMILTNLVTLVFPSLIGSLVNESTIEEYPYELGAFAIPIIITNVGVFVFGVLFYSNKMPSLIQKLVKFVYNFEVSRNIAIFAFVVLLFGYIGYAMQDIGEDEGDTWGDFPNLKNIVDKWPVIGEGSTNESLGILHVKNFFLKSSLVVFQNIRVIPFLASISLVILTYFFTVKITQKRFRAIPFCGLVLWLLMITFGRYFIFSHCI